MATRNLSALEKRILRAGGFSLAKRKRRSPQFEWEAARFAAAVEVLNNWEAGLPQSCAILALPSRRALAALLARRRPVPKETLNRAFCLLAIAHHFVELTADMQELKPLPELPDGVGRRRPALEILARGRLSDLLRLWLQLERKQERGPQRNRRRRSPVQRSRQRKDRRQ